MKKLLTIILIGTLSMLFAEVFSGASQAWFFNAWSLIATFPLYLFHLLFLLWIALNSKKISISQLYLFGIIFALYESWITKVLWTGYIVNATKPALGTILGLGISEFPILVFFFHPIMSFIVPILVFEILNKQAVSDHAKLLEKNRKKSKLILLFLASIGTFIANGNQFNLLSANISLIGTIIIILILLYFTQKTNLEFFKFKKNKFILISAYLLLLYVLMFFYLLPEKIPTTAVSYLSIIIFYIFPISLLINSKKENIEYTNLTDKHYTAKDLGFFSIFVVLTTNIFCLIPNVAASLLFISYYIIWLLGITIFGLITYKALKKQ